MGSRDRWIPKVIQPSKGASEILSQGSKVREQERKTLSSSGLFMYTHGQCTYILICKPRVHIQHNTYKRVFKKRTCLFIVLPHLLLGLLDISMFYGSLKFIIDITLCQSSASKDFLPSRRVYLHLVICFCCCKKFFCLISCVFISQCQPYFLNYSGPQEAIICGYPALLFSFLYPLAVQQVRSSIKLFDPFGVDFCAG